MSKTMNGPLLTVKGLEPAAPMSPRSALEMQDPRLHSRLAAFYQGPGYASAHCSLGDCASGAQLTKTTAVDFPGQQPFGVIFTFASVCFSIA